MKILYLCADTGIPVRGSKGAAIHVRALIEAFARLGHDVTLVAARAGSPDGARLSARLIEAAWEGASSSSPAAREQAAMVAAEAVLREARAAASRERFDLIYERYSLWSTAGAQLASETGLPYVAEVNAPLRLEALRYRSLVHAQMAVDVERRVWQSATALVAVSEPVKQYLVERGAPPLKVHVLPNAVDDRLFHPGVDGHETRLWLGLEGKFVVGFAGTERPWHDLNTLIAAMEQLQSRGAEQPVLSWGQRGPYHLLLVGAFSDAVTSTLIDRGLIDHTTILGPLPQAEIPPLLAAMDVAVSPHPALPGFYFSPLKLFEYLACGRATLAANVPPIAAALRDETDALLYRAGEADDLARRIATLAADPLRREALGMAAAKQVLVHHTWIGNARRTLAVIGRWESGPHADTAEESPIWDDVLGRRLYRASRLDLANKSFSTRLDTCCRTPFARLRVLKYWPGKRCVLAYGGDPQDAGVPHSVIVGKVFREGKAQARFEDQQALWADGFGPDAADHVVVAAPLGHIPEMNMFVQAYAPGSPLDQLLDAPDLEGRVRMAAAAISKLHGSHVRPRATYALQNELANLEGWAADMTRLRPELADHFGRQLQGLQRRAMELHSPEPVPIHRDFYYSQLLYSEAGVTLIDLDLLALGDPAIDVANFAAHLQFLAMQRLGSPRALDRMKQVFVDHYLRLRPMPGGAAGLAFYEAATLFRLQYVALTRPAYAPYFEGLLHSLNLQVVDPLETHA